MQTYFSPAKINLFLHAIQKRDDGFTEIVSFFQAVDLFDQVSFAFANEDRLICNDPTIPTDTSNTIVQALELFRKKTGQRFFMEIHINKRIPAMAGLGGGSGNAATALWALNELTSQNLSNEELACWGAEIGSDIPFFFSQGQALIRGRGEIVEPVVRNVPFSAWLAKPSFGLSTATVFRALDFSFCSEKKIGPCFEKIEYSNDLEKPAMEIEPRLQEVKKELLSMGFEHVVMTGSGTTFFCLGSITPKPLDGVVFIPVKSTSRHLASWY